MRVPTSLRRLCIEYVARNLHHVDSLVGFPPQVGVELWNAYAGSCCHYKADAALVAVFQLFVDGYEAEFLSRAKLFRLDVINDYEDTLIVGLKHVTHLDLSSAQLGDNHDLLRQIGRECRCLTVLAMERSNLSNRGLRTLFGIGQSSQCTVRDLVVCGNPDIDAHGLAKYATQSTHLKMIVYSIHDASRIKSDTGTLKRNNFALKSNTKPRVNIHTTGWAAKAINDWHTRSVRNQHQKQQKAKEVTSLKGKFYGQKQISRPTSRYSAAQFNGTSCDFTFERMQCQSVRASCNNTLPPNSKRPRLIDSEDLEFEAIKQLYT